ncbi:hypothetical protein CVT26_009753 [Gymnopilus dilepis]|uniref:Brl1/Brr6 domain-containing protein n=1 Tax=Gymnopilus dilepis TaxID=231916 RepID=A0A409VKK9_9AGAR|nr:hypothetical protein CVT26_009753 [Gymnopilus dilepis]
MASRYTFTQRSKEAPMDFQWTNRPSVKPAWVAASDDPSTPRKRNHDAMNPPTPSISNTPQQPTFGANQNVPFLFQPVPLPQSPQPHPWAPPPDFSPSKAFRSSEAKDVDMTEASPAKQEESKPNGTPAKDKEVENANGRPVATGGLRRVYRQRIRRARSTHRSRADDEESEGESDEEGAMTPVTQNTSNHYTLNMPAHPAPQSDTPYVLLGYLQFFFNLSLILIFLYLFVQFIITVQRDVALRISEYSQDIIQEISLCATQFRNNRCSGESPIPAMVQQCANWEACMNRDPAVVGRAKVGAELIAEVINGFVEPISWKTLIFTLTSLAFLTVFINTLLSLYRAKHQPIAEAARHPAPPYALGPSNAPFPSQFGAYLPPTHASGWGRYRPEEDLETPPRRRRLENGDVAKIK